MPNANQDKGKRNERNAVKFLVEHFEDLVDVKNPARLLGEGRREDGGDLNVFSDTTVQVKAWKNLGAGIHDAARSAVEQADYADKTFAVGMVPIPRAQPGTVSWLFCQLADADASVEVADSVVTFARASDLITWIRDDAGPKGYIAHDRQVRVATLKHGSAPAVEVMTSEAWSRGLASARTRGES